MNRNTNLDVLRGIAVILVLFRHLTLDPADNSIINLAFLGMRRIGWLGVDIFFVLSGFLVTRLLYKELLFNGKANVVRFIKRRSLKIFPLFYLFIFGTVIVLGDFKSSSYTNLIVELAFLQSYFTGFWVHTWSLSVEEHFYLIIAALFGLTNLLSERRANALLIPIALLAVTSLAIRSYISLTNFEFSFHTHIAPSYLRFDGLALGAFTAITTLQSRQLSPRTILTMRTLVLTVTLVITPYFLLHSQETSVIVRTLGYFLVALLTALVIATIQLSPKEQQTPTVPAVVRVISNVGIDSYATYLIHVPLFEQIYANLPDRLTPNWLVGSTCIVFAVFSGRLISMIIDQPLMRLRERLCP